MGNLYRWCLAGFLAVVLVNAAYADSVAASTGYKVDELKWFSTVREACDYGNTIGKPYPGVTSSDFNSMSADGRMCKYGKAGVCSDCYSIIPVQGIYCPVGILNGSVCELPTSCPPGEFRDPTQGNICVKDCTAKQGQAAPNGYYSTATESWTGSVSGCQVRCSKLTALVISASTAAIMQNCTYTGKGAQQGDPDLQAEAAPDPNKPKSPKDCAGAGMGYITGSSGTATCVPASDAPEGNKPNVKTNTGKESGPDANGDGKPDTDSPDYKKEETETTKNGDTVTSKTKETINGTTDSNGVVTCPAGYTKNADNTCSKTTATAQNASSFCQENPNSEQCKGAEKSTFGGGCDTGFTCSGDAATCATAKATWQLNCQFEKTSPASEFGSQLVSGNDAANLPGAGKSDLTLNVGNLTYTDTAGSCLPDLQYNMMGRSLTVPTAGVCNIGGWLGNIGVALSFLIAGFIVIGGIKAT